MQPQKFQSLMGFHVRCNPAAGNYTPDHQSHVSIPNGFSRSLQRYNFAVEAGATEKFQSLMGFHVRCNNATTVPCTPEVAPFQSLMGFHVRCNT